MRSGEVKRRNCAVGVLPSAARLLDLRVLGQRLRPHIGGEQLRMALFKPEVGGLLVAEEHVAVADEELVDARHRRFGGGIVAHDFRAGNGGAESVRFKKRLDPFEAPLQRAHDAIFIARGEPGFPVVHPARVFFLEHVLSSSLPAPAPALARINNEPDQAQDHDQRNIDQRNDAVETPDAQYIALNVSQVKREMPSRRAMPA